MQPEQALTDTIKISQNTLSPNQFASLPYFTRYFSLLSQKECKSKASKVHKYFKLAKVKKGSIMYGCEDTADKGFIILNGCFQFLKKKSLRQRTQSFAGHICHSLQQKQNYLYQHFKIPKSKVESLTNLFYQQKIQFKYLVFHTLMNGEQFGFGQMTRNTNRIHTIVAIQQTELLFIQKSNFDQHLRDFNSKRQKSLIRKIISGCNQEMADQMMPKMLQIMNISTLLNFDNEDVVYNEHQFPSELYFIIQGQVEVRKKSIFTIPKKFMKHQIKDLISKQLITKVSKMSKGSFFGQQQIFSGRKIRNFSVVSTLNDTLILKIDHSLFLKSLSDFGQYQRMLIQNSVFKKANYDESFQRQYQKIFKTFINQYQVYDSKKKEDLISNLMSKGENKTQTFQAFAPQGVFFRDTFQKLQGFEDSLKTPNKKNSIKRFKQKSSVEASSSNKVVKKQINLNQSIINKFGQKQIKQKILFSPKRSMNIAEIYVQEMNSQMKNEESKTHSNSPELISPNKMSLKYFKRQKQINKNKFEEIQKDEKIYKRVLIKNGLYPVQKKIDKSKSVRALVHHNFDQIVKQCITRKNQVIRRTSKTKQQQIIMDTYNKTISNLKNRTTGSSAHKFSRFTAPCRGTEELKKRMQSIHNLGSARLTDTSEAKKRSLITKIEDCIGFNEKPKSSQVSYRDNKADRSTLFSSINRSPEKIVLLNHMMKPITYFKSTQL